MSNQPCKLSSAVSALALWGLLASAPPTAWGHGAAPAIRGFATLDAVVANRSFQIERLCLNDGSGSLQSGTSCASFNTTDASYAVALGDLDGDGDLDAVIATNGLDRICLNVGGGFSSCSSFNTGDFSYAVALGDLDGDGDLDAVLATGSGNERVCLNVGGGFPSCSSFNTSDNSLGIALGDVNGDGALDVVVGNFGQAPAFCLNVGGSFPSCNTFGSSLTARGVALGDVDGDGSLDVVLATSSLDQLCLNVGGGFSSCSSFNTSDASRSAVLGDVDGDGSLDVVLANNGVERVCLNVGGGFSSCSSFNTGDNSYGVALGDVDGDGDLDAVIANRSATEMRCLNDGGGNFSSCAGFNTGDYSMGVALGDVQGDGPFGGLEEVTQHFTAPGGVGVGTYFALSLAKLKVAGGSAEPAGLYGIYEFDAIFCNQSNSPISELRSRTVKITKGNALRFNGLFPEEFLTAPEWREGGIGSELLAPESPDYSGTLDPGDCATMRYSFNLFSSQRFEFGVRLYGVPASEPDAPNIAHNALDWAASAHGSVPALKINLGALDADTAETPPPGETPAGGSPVASPGGAAPTPGTTGFPVGVSHLPNRR